MGVHSMADEKYQLHMLLSYETKEEWHRLVNLFKLHNRRTTVDDILRILIELCKKTRCYSLVSVRHY